MKSVSKLQNPRFRIDSISLSLQMAMDEVMACLEELQQEQLVTLHLATRQTTNHALFIGEVSLNG